jgi:hypothetical protein
MHEYSGRDFAHRQSLLLRLRYRRRAEHHKQGEHRNAMSHVSASVSPGTTSIAASSPKKWFAPQQRKGGSVTTIVPVACHGAPRNLYRPMFDREERQR